MIILYGNKDVLECYLPICSPSSSGMLSGLLVEQMTYTLGCKLSGFGCPISFPNFVQVLF